MRTQWWAIALVLLTTALTSSAQVLYKLGVNAYKAMGVVPDAYLPVGGGLVLYGVGAVLMVLSLRGGELSVLYPIIATSYIWVSLLSMAVFGEPMNPFKWAGVAFIVVGVVAIGVGGKEVPV